MTRPLLLPTLALLLLTTPAASLHAASGAIAIKIKLNSLILPSIDFQETPLEDALEFLRQKSDQLDTKGFGVNMVIDSEVDSSATIPSLSLKNVPLSTVLRYVCELTGNKYTIDRHAVLIYRPKAKVADSHKDESPGEHSTKPAPPPPSKPNAASFKIRGKLEHIVLPQIDFYETPIPEAIEYLRQKSAELDTLETDPAQKGVNFVITGTLPEPPPTVSLKLQEVPLSDVLRYLTGLADMTYDIGPHAVTIRP